MYKVFPEKLILRSQQTITKYEKNNKINVINM